MPNDVDRSEDGRWIIVNGRRWRATDPAIPEPLRQELVDALMSARRTVGVAKRSGDETAERAARDRVQNAKVALGERGEPWWEQASTTGRRARLRASILTLAGHRSPDRTICPSDAARAVGGPAWRSQMDEARSVATELAEEGLVEITQRGEPVDLAGWRGPVRIRQLTGA